MRESVRTASANGLIRHEVLGIVSLLLWTLTLIVTVKYVVLVMRADNHGEGGTLSLVALIQQSLSTRPTWLIGIGTILAGIVGVSNIMLIAVQERTREIGVRKAVGATPGAIVGLIVQEALVITAVSGYVGMLAGIGALELAARLVPKSDFMRDPEVDIGVVLGATLVLVVSGLLAGYFPARRAARINPSEALRAE